MYECRQCSGSTVGVVVVMVNCENYSHGNELTVKQITSNVGSLCERYYRPIGNWNKLMNHQIAPHIIRMLKMSDCIVLHPGGKVSVASQIGAEQMAGHKTAATEHTYTI